MLHTRLPLSSSSARHAQSIHESLTLTARQVDPLIRRDGDDELVVGVAENAEQRGRLGRLAVHDLSAGLRRLLLEHDSDLIHDKGEVRVVVCHDIFHQVVDFGFGFVGCGHEGDLQLKACRSDGRPPASHISPGSLPPL